ncbi:MAG TPA: sugar phosphate nucleotidyltransferase [Mycobacteriales bacterium]|nr:sugar phosphate nucleotidyltransferase [Mycobacteriales bacterium]HWC34257.1 sugar phosphate nucleotidyltransferase [Mycobacteriales bacterium]
MRALILCGGRGIRAWPATADVPKPMLQVGGRPVLHHVMEIYARHGVTDFVLAAGYKHDVIEAYADHWPHDWKVDVVDTGEEADTGDRVVACLDRVGETFHATYGDGVGNVDIAALDARHAAHGGGATVTVVPLPSQYGTLVIDDAGQVTDFREKPVLADHLINAGFFVFDRDRFAQCSGSSLERDILPALGQRGELFVYRHEGFWKSMDTQKDVSDLDALARREDPPWLAPEH